MSKLITLAGGHLVGIDNIDVDLPSNVIDMFSRLRVSEPTTQVVINQSSALRSRFITEGQASGTGTSATYTEHRASTTLTVGTSVGLRRLKTFVPGLYQPGKSLLFFFTFNLGAAQTGVTKRVGYFDGSDGIFLEQTDAGLSWVLRASSSGTVVETERAAQADWDMDKFNNGSVTYDFDPTKCHIGFIALEWLGVGDVVVGFVFDRIPVPAHIFEHPNLRSEVYMRTANLYPCFEIERTQAGGTPASLEAICGALLTEGVENDLGFTYSISRGITSTFQARTSGAFYCLLLWRLDPTKISARIKIAEVEMMVISTCNYHLYLVRQPTFNVAYTPTWATRSNSSLQYDVNVPDTIQVTNAIENETYTLSSARGNNFSFGGNFDSSLDYLGTDFNYQPEVWGLVIQCDSGNVNIRSAVAKFWEQL